MAENGYKVHRVSYGDSIQKIATQYGVQDWREIAYFNNLVYPYIVDNLDIAPNGKVAVVGDSVFIPSNEFINYPKAKEDYTMEEQAYGVDLDIYYATDDNGKARNLEERGEMSLDDRDLRLVKGIENLVQQLTIKLSTRKGSLMLHPEWGCNILNMVGTKGTEENLTDMMLMVKEAILEDFRVESISNLSVSKTATSVTIDCNITPIAPYPEFHFNKTIFDWGE